MITERQLNSEFLGFILTGFNGPKTMKEFSLGLPLKLKICFGIKESIFRPIKLSEPGIVLQMLLTPFKILSMIGFKKKLSTGLENPYHRIQKGPLEEAATMMLRLGPRVRAKQMNTV